MPKIGRTLSIRRTFIYLIKFAGVVKDKIFKKKIKHY